LSLKGRVGIFGGTFNPLHNAHMRVAHVALAQYELASVLFVPNGIPPDRGPVEGVTGEDRYRMIQAAVAGEGRFAVSRIEIDRKGPSYTIDTIRALKEDCRQGICFILGADRLRGIKTWREPEALLRSVPFLVAPREGVSAGVFGQAPFDMAEVYALKMEEVDLSSSWLRDKVARGEGIAEWVPLRVAEYVAKNGLYRNRKLTGVRAA